mgnify:CR=1 FL=1
MIIEIILVNPKNIYYINCIYTQIIKKKKIILMKQIKTTIINNIYPIKK